MEKKDTSIVLVKQVQSKILFLRGEKVILDSDLKDEVVANCDHLEHKEYIKSGHRSKYDILYTSDE